MLNKVSFVLFFTGVEVCTWHPWHPCGTGIPSRWQLLKTVHLPTLLALSSLAIELDRSTIEAQHICK